MWISPAAAAAFHIFSASARVLASGFSHRICFSACAAAIAMDMCESPGVQMSMMSMSLRAMTSSQRVAYSSQPRRSAASLTFASVRPATTFITGSQGRSGMKRATCRQALEWARPMKSYPIIATFSFLLAIDVPRDGSLSRISLPPAPLDRDALGFQHFVLERIHASCGLVDLACESNRAGQDRFELFLVLNARLRILVLDHQIGVGDVELQQLARRELMVEPVDSAVLQVAQRIVPCRAGQLVLTQDDLFFPRVKMIGSLGRRLAIDPVPALHGLAPVAPSRDAFRIHDLPLYVKATDQVVVAFVLQVLEDRARVLAHQDGVGRIVMDTEIVAHTVLLADSGQCDPRTRCVRDVVVIVVEDGPAGHRTLLDAVLDAACFSFLEQWDEHFLEHLQVLVYLQLLIAADEPHHGRFLE